MPSSYQPSALWSKCLCPLIDILIDVQVSIYCEANVSKSFSYKLSALWSRCLCSLKDFFVDAQCKCTGSSWSQRKTRLPHGKLSSYQPSALWSWCLCPLIDLFLFDAQVPVHCETNIQTDNYAASRPVISHLPGDVSLSSDWLFCLMHRYRFIVKPTDSQITMRQAVLLSAICLVISVSLSSNRFFCLMHRYRFIVKPTDSQITTRQSVLLSAALWSRYLCLLIDFFVWCTGTGSLWSQQTARSPHGKLSSYQPSAL